MAEIVEPAGYVSKVERDWTVPQGADTTNAFRYGTQTGEDPVVYPDLTDGWSAHAQIRDVVGGTVWVEFDSADSTGARIDMDASGYITVVLPHGVTEAWDTTVRKRGVYDLELTNPDDIVIRLAKGRITVSPDVTREESSSA